jgi:hypothetical protein
MVRAGLDIRGRLRIRLAFLRGRRRRQRGVTRSGIRCLLDDRSSSGRNGARCDRRGPSRGAGSSRGGWREWLTGLTARLGIECRGRRGTRSRTANGLLPASRCALLAFRLPPAFRRLRTLETRLRSRWLRRAKRRRRRSRESIRDGRLHRRRFGRMILCPEPSPEQHRRQSHGGEDHRDTRETAERLRQREGSEAQRNPKSPSR